MKFVRRRGEGCSVVVKVDADEPTNSEHLTYMEYVCRTGTRYG